MRIGIGTRLVALVTLPLLAAGALAWSFLDGDRRAAHDAAQVERGLDEVRGLILVRYGLLRERGGTEAAMRAAALGFDEAAAATLIGPDIFRERGAGRALVDEQLRTSATARAAVDDARLLAVRRAAADLTGGIEVPVAAFRALDAEIGTAIEERLARLSRVATQVDPSHGLDDQVANVRSMAQIIVLAHEQASGLTRLWLDDAALQPSNLVDLARTTALLDDRVAVAAGRQTPGFADRLAAAMSTTPAVVFRLDLERALANPGIAPDLGRLAATFSAAIERGFGLDEVLERTTESAATRAADFRREAQRRLAARVGGAGGFGLLIVAITAAVARGIRRPLRRLADHANELRSGNLAVPIASVRGLPEVQDATRAMADLTDNLRLVDAQGRALAAHRLDDESLDRGIPGPLRATLQATFRLLSDTMIGRERLQERLSYQASHDALTGLLNRSAALAHLGDALDDQTRGGPTVALLFVDLDSFKIVNDTFGHGAGDHLLQTVATRMRAVTRHGDLVARLGGDEFLIIERVAEGTLTAVRLAERIVAAIGEPIIWGTEPLTVRACIGISFAEPGDEPDDALAHADMAVLEAKRRGPGSTVQFDETLREQIATRDELETALRDALRDGGRGLRVEYQPIQYFDGRATTHLEALVRWVRPDVGPVPTQAFIEAAEATSLVVEVDRWVLAHVVDQLGAWLAADPHLDIQVNVNVSGKHVLSPSLPTTVATLLEGSTIRPEMLALEVTETALVADLDTAARHLRAIRACGVRIAIDDFGTGYTSIAHLRQLPVVTIKIDGSFVSRIDEERERSLVQTLIDLGHRLDLEVVAEWVESAHQLQVLRELGCDAGQGFYFGASQPAGAIPSWVGTRTAGHT